MFVVRVDSSLLLALMHHIHHTTVKYRFLKNPAVSKHVLLFKHFYSTSLRRVNRWRKNRFPQLIRAVRTCGAQPWLREVRNTAGCCCCWHVWVKITRLLLLKPMTVMYGVARGPTWWALLSDCSSCGLPNVNYIPYCHLQFTPSLIVDDSIVFSAAYGP